MKYNKTVRLKDGRECLFRNGDERDGKALLDLFLLTHRQTDFLASYPDECSFTVGQESEYLKKKTESEREIELLAFVDGKLVASAGIGSIGRSEKSRHRAEFGISVDQSCWGLGIGRALTDACVECAEKAGYTQIELEVVADNERAIALYKSAGFVEFGRNPHGFNSRYSGKQSLVMMYLELKNTQKRETPALKRGG